MLLAFDTYYQERRAKTVCLQFADWAAAAPLHVYEAVTAEVEDYVPGAFYKRELPCILSLLQQISLAGVAGIIIDGFVFLDDGGRPGLGARLYHQLDGRIPVIGVAKTNFATLSQLKRPVLRGSSRNPLFVTAIGMDADTAAANVAAMHGEYRMPTLLQQLDALTRS